MILSQKSIFSDNQAITADALSTNVLLLQENDNVYGASSVQSYDIGRGTPIPIEIVVTETFATLTSLTISVECGAADTLGTELASLTIAAAALVKGYRIPITALPAGVNARYLGLRYNVNGSDATAGKITAGLSLGNQTPASGF